MRTMLVLPVTLHQILSALIKGNIRFTNQFTKTKAIEKCIILLKDQDQVAAVIFMKKTKVSDFGTSERFSINSLKLSTN